MSFEDAFTREKKGEIKIGVKLKLLEVLCSTQSMCRRPMRQPSTNVSEKCGADGGEKKKADKHTDKISQGRVHTRFHTIIILTSMKMSSNIFKLNFWY